VIRVGYQGPPHPVFGLVSMLEDQDYEVTYNPPDLSAQEPVEVELSVTDIQLKGVDGLEAVIQEFNNRHPELPITIRVLPPV
jgi:CheY-like chemotaxis protein